MSTDYDERAILQWANGRADARRAGQSRFSPGLVGFFTERGKHAALDAAMTRAGIEQIDIRHTREGGPASEVGHWYLGERLDVLPLTATPPARTLGMCMTLDNRAAACAAGLGMVWTQDEANQGQLGRSRLVIQVHVNLLLSVGYRAPLLLTARSRMTDKLLAALLDHSQVCQGAMELEKVAAAHPTPLAHAELLLPLQAGPEEAFGKAATSLVVPLQSGHPAAVTEQYVRDIWRAKEAAALGALDLAEVEAWARGVFRDASGGFHGATGGGFDAGAARAAPALGELRGALRVLLAEGLPPEASAGAREALAIVRAVLG